MRARGGGRGGGWVGRRALAIRRVAEDGAWGRGGAQRGRWALGARWPKAGAADERPRPGDNDSFLSCDTSAALVDSGSKSNRRSPHVAESYPCEPGERRSCSKAAEQLPDECRAIAPGAEIRYIRRDLADVGLKLAAILANLIWAKQVAYVGRFGSALGRFEPKSDEFWPMSAKPGQTLSQTDHVWPNYWLNWANAA